MWKVQQSKNDSLQGEDFSPPVIVAQCFWNISAEMTGIYTDEDKAIGIKRGHVSERDILHLGCTLRAAKVGKMAR